MNDLAYAAAVLYPCDIRQEVRRRKAVFHFEEVKRTNLKMAMVKSLGRNIPYLRQQFAALLGNTSTSVKFICIVVLFSYCLSYSQDAVKALSVTPGYLLPPAFWIWTAFTFCFLEIHFWEVCVDIITVGLCGKLIEPLWGAMEMMIFFAIVNFGVAVLSTLFYLFLYMCTNNTDLLFDIHIHGLTGYIAGTFNYVFISCRLYE